MFFYRSQRRFQFRFMYADVKIITNSEWEVGTSLQGLHSELHWLYSCSCQITNNVTIWEIHKTIFCICVSVFTITKQQSLPWQNSDGLTRLSESMKNEEWRWWCVWAQNPDMSLVLLLFAIWMLVFRTWCYNINASLSHSHPHPIPDALTLP